MNTYAVFAETARTVIGPHGRSGLVLPTGIATDATTAPFFGDLVRNAKLVSFLDFENEASCSAAPSIIRSASACSPSAAAQARVNLASFAFGTRYMRDLPRAPRSRCRPRRSCSSTRTPAPPRSSAPAATPRSPSASTSVSPSSGAKTPKRTPGACHSWRCSHGQRLRPVPYERRRRVLPLYEAKMIHHFDHRLGTYERPDRSQANMGTLPRLLRSSRTIPLRHSAALLGRQDGGR